VAIGKKACPRSQVLNAIYGARREESPGTIHILPVKGNPKGLLATRQADADDWRAPLLKPLKTTFSAPSRVGLYLFKDGSWVIENFNDRPADIKLNGKSRTIAPRAWQYGWK